MWLIGLVFTDKNFLKMKGVRWFEKNTWFLFASNGTVGQHKQETYRSSNVHGAAGQNQQYCFQLWDLEHYFHIPL